ncbi:MAG: sel1 repeat family protein [Bacteroidales bacterium]|nr:sel1 repeat family protein [Bacteroidales bacterium]
MNRIILLVVALFSAINVAFGQFKLEFESFEEIPNDLSARTNPKLDLNGEPAALLKIQIPLLQDATILSSQKIGQEQYDPGEFKVYLCDGTKRVVIRHQDFEPFEFTFNEPLKGKTVYRLVLRVPDDYISLGAVSVKFNTNVLNATLQIDGNEYKTESGEFYFKLKKGSYSYTLKTSLEGYSPVNGVLDITDNDVKEAGRLDKYIDLQSDKKSNLHISAVNGSKVKIDGIELKNLKKTIPLSRGRHNVEVELNGFHNTLVINLLNDNEYLDADIRVPFTIVSPTVAEFSISPIDNAIKPSINKFKANQQVRLLGKYKIIAKAKGYETKEIEVAVSPEMSKNGVNITIPMISDAYNLFNGSGNVKQNINKAMKEYRKKIANGDELAMWEYGEILLEQNNISQGQTMIKLAADKGHPKSALYTALNYSGLSDDDKQKYLEIAINGGEDQAHEILGDMYAEKRDIEKAYSEYSQSNSSSSNLKTVYLAIQYPDKINLTPYEIRDKLELIDSTDPNFGLAQNLLGELAYRGLGMERNLQAAVEYWANASPEVLSQQALIIMGVKNLNTSRLDDYAKYISLKEYAEDCVIIDGVSLVQFLCRAAQQLDKKDINTAFQFLSKSYELGDRSLTTVSYLGKYYKDGTGVNKNPQLAKEMLKLAVDQYNDVRAMRWLGNIYENEKDLKSAELYYKKAITLNDPLAKGYYATLLYNKGNANYAKAVKLWSEAAEAGHKQSIKNLITYYEKVERNPSKAKYWKGKL